MGDPCISSYTIQFLFLGNAKNHLPWGFLGLPARVRDPPASPLHYLLASRPRGSPALQWRQCLGDLLMASPPHPPFLINPNLMRVLLSSFFKTNNSSELQQRRMPRWDPLPWPLHLLPRAVLSLVYF